MDEAARLMGEMLKVLKHCQYALNMIPNTKLPGLDKPDSYAVASEVDAVLARADAWIKERK